MPVILFRKDPFVENGGAVEAISPQKAGSLGVRRPLYGYVPKADRYASLSITQAQPSGGQVPISILDSSAPRKSSDAEGTRGRSNRTTNFFVTAVAHADSEKFQIVETFGDSYVFFFGRRPFILQVNGLLMNTVDFNWKSEWLENYETYLRGTKCVENKARVHFRVDDRLYSGYILGTSISDEADQMNVSMFGFQMLVYSQTDLTTKSVVSLQETRVVGDQLYVDYVDGVLPTVDLYDLDPVTGLSTPQGTAGALEALLALTEGETVVRVEKFLRDNTLESLDGEMLPAVEKVILPVDPSAERKGQGTRSGEPVLRGVSGAAAVVA